MPGLPKYYCRTKKNSISQACPNISSVENQEEQYKLSLSKYQPYRTTFVQAKLIQILDQSRTVQVRLAQILALQNQEQYMPGLPKYQPCRTKKNSKSQAYLNIRPFRTKNSRSQACPNISHVKTVKNSTSKGCPNISPVEPRTIQAKLTQSLALQNQEQYKPRLPKYQPCQEQYKQSLPKYQPCRTKKNSRSHACPNIYPVEPRRTVEVRFAQILALQNKEEQYKPSLPKYQLSRIKNRTLQACPNISSVKNSTSQACPNIYVELMYSTVSYCYYITRSM